MYKANSISTYIEKEEITRFSDKSVWYICEYKGIEVREARYSKYESFHETFKEAKMYLIGINEQKVKKLNVRIRYAEKELDEAFNLKDN